MDIQKYTGIYATSGDVREAVSAGTLHNPYIAIVQDGNYIDWNGNSSPTPPVPPEPVYSAMPLTFEIISGGTIGWYRNGGISQNSRTIQYSLNDGEWITITSNTGSSAPSISVATGDKIRFIGDNKTYNPTTANYFGGTARFRAYGNIMSLISSTGYTELSSFEPVNRQAFSYLFKDNTGIYDAEHLILPVKQLEYEVYSHMFYYCSNLVKGPAILAETMSVRSCEAMFNNCTNLNYIKCLATNISANNCTLSWVMSVASSGTFVKHLAMNDWPTGQNGIPSGWTVIDADI